MGLNDRKGSWFARLPTIVKVGLGAVFAAFALAVAFTDVIDRLPEPVAAALVIAIGVVGLVLAGRKDWASEARKEPSHLLLYLLRPLPLTAWRIVMAVLALGIVALGVGGLVGSLT